MRPRLLDLFAGAGGSSMGYHRAGFDVVGVDIAAQPDYPFEFHQLDATALRMDANGCIHEYGPASSLPGRSSVCLGHFDAVHASPPCQASSGPTKGTNARRNTAKGIVHPQLIPTTRRALDATGLPYVIENVQGSELRRDLTLCGLMFGLRVFRHRYFEVGGWVPPAAPHHPSHRGHRVSGWRHGVRHDGDMLAVYGDGGGKATTQECREGLGIDWSDDRSRLVEAIPPAYTSFIGARLLEHVRAVAA